MDPDFKKEKWAFIVNPTAGNGFAKSMVPVIEEKLKKYGIDGEILLTERSGHAAESLKIMLRERIQIYYRSRRRRHDE